jgi:hypothetical protein
LLKERTDRARPRRVEGVDDSTRQAKQDVQAEFVTTGDQRADAGKRYGGDSQHDVLFDGGHHQGFGIHQLSGRKADDRGHIEDPAADHEAARRGGRPARCRTRARTSSGGGPPKSLVTRASARSLSCSQEDPAVS